jgi:PAS domain S-box-containing protein
VGDKNSAKIDLRIAIVDDQEIVLKVTRRRLELWGYARVDTFDNAEAFLAHLQVNPCDVLLSDISMPGMDGLALLAEVQLRSPQTAVLLMSGYVDTYDARAALGRGAVDFLTKPMDAEELQLSLQRITLLHQAQSDADNRLQALNEQLIEEINAHKQRQAELRARVRQQQAIAELSGQAMQGVGLERLQQAVVGLLVETLEVDASCIFLLNEGKRVSATSRGFDPPPNDAEAAHMAQLLIGDLKKVQEAVFEWDVGDLCCDSCLVCERGFVTGLVAVLGPLQAPLALLGIYSSSARTFSRDDRHFAESVANVLAMSMEQQRTSTALNKLSRAVEQSPSVIVITDSDGMIEYVNPQFTKVTGYSASEALGQNPRILQSGEMDAVQYKQMWKTIRAGGEWRGEFHNRRKNGELFWEKASISPVRDTQGEITHFIGIKEDITEHKQLEDAIRSVAIGGRYWGERFLEDVALKMAASLGADYTLIGELDAAAEKVRTLALCIDGRIVDNIVYELAGTPCYNVVGTGVCSYPCDAAQLFPEDTMLADMGVEAYVGIPLFDSHETPLGIMVALFRRPLEKADLAESILQVFAARTAAEIERNRIEHTLRESEERFRIVFDSSGDCIWVVNRSGHYLYANRAAIDYVGSTPEEMIGGSMVDILGQMPGVLAVWQERIEQVFCSGESLLLEDAGHWGDRFVYSESAVSPLLYESGEIFAVAIIYRDVTKRKQSEEMFVQSSRLISLGEMAAGVAHELNQPLTAMMVIAEGLLLRQEQGIAMRPEQLARWARDVQEQTQRMSSIVEHLRLFSRDHHQEPPVLVNLNGVVGSALHLVGAQLRNHGIDVSLDLQQDLAPVMGNANRLEQVLVNLLTNARDSLDEKAERDSAISKDLFVRTLAENGDIILEVEDRGLGIAEDVKDYLFQPFFTTKDPDRGTGLGLSITYSIIKDHEGSIECKSQVGEGALFRIALPVAVDLE